MGYGGRAADYSGNYGDHQGKNNSSNLSCCRFLDGNLTNFVNSNPLGNHVFVYMPVIIVEIDICAAALSLH